MYDIAIIIVVVFSLIFIHLLWKEGEATTKAQKRLEDLKNFKVRNPVRNISRIRTIYLKLPELSGERKKSFEAELQRRLDACVQQYGNAPSSIEEAESLYNKVRRGR